MKEIRKINDRIDQFVFSEEDNNLEINITAIYDEKKAVLIDAGYVPQALAVKKHLDRKGIEVTELILTHYHPDHAAGANIFQDAKLSCSIHYEENYINCNERWHGSHNYRKPDELIKDKDEIIFGETSLIFYEAPGHSDCSLIISINGQFLHVGDLIMVDAFGCPALPYISIGGSFEEHIESLELIHSMPSSQLLLSHGAPIKNQRNIEDAINKRLFYLESVIKTQGEEDLEQLLAGGKDAWCFTKWHPYNLKNL
jgi:glyoxylase-like metal-dependent hydrolase (beta-lactamase superfamily II)